MYNGFLPCPSSHYDGVLNPDVTTRFSAAQDLKIKGVMTGTQAREIEGKVVGVKEATGVAVFLTGVPYPELCARVGIAPGITDGTGALPGLLQRCHIETAAGNWFGRRRKARDRREKKDQKSKQLEHSTRCLIGECYSHRFTDRQ